MSGTIRGKVIVNYELMLSDPDPLSKDPKYVTFFWPNHLPIPKGWVEVELEWPGDIQQRLTEEIAARMQRPSPSVDLFLKEFKRSVDFLAERVKRLENPVVKLRCASIEPGGRCERCVLPEGHPGLHMSRFGHTWAGHGPREMCAHLYAELPFGANPVRCTRDHGHEGRHAFRWEG